MTAQFSPEVRTELADALAAYITAEGTGAEAAVRAATDRVVTEAHALALSPEAMVIALKRLHDDLPHSELFRDHERRRAAFDRFVSRSIQAYFDQGGKAGP